MDAAAAEVASDKKLMWCHMRFLVEGYADDCKVSLAAETARKALSKAVEWDTVKQLNRVTISHGAMSYSVAEFSEAMARRDFC